MFSQWSRESVLSLVIILKPLNLPYRRSKVIYNDGIMRHRIALDRICRYLSILVTREFLQQNRNHEAFYSLFLFLPHTVLNVYTYYREIYMRGIIS